MTAKKEVSNNEILEAMELFAKSVDRRFDELKGELSAEIKSVKGELSEFKSEMASALAYIHSELKLINRQLDQLEQRIIGDEDAAAKDILELRKRVDFLERQVKQLQVA
ncbi:MAG: hypothetical protein A3J93_02065 [Candidatus Magasanikbacteria bacterium RIFOXYC2_FULL_42_28]|uniref:Uncharacterized protein n=1 Tax=Candidatus Magasanikbacteria bacterium RIFOXYC2_FULL_42_28 TaxID=1798704 RepID=A0A1F6NX43_9BACT|nr:MAG: hypothetical protein A3J93_02065 [Candidatus Magasanikbacteria bacterium RIFOXYC2_FULL_42_28]